MASLATLAAVLGLFDDLTHARVERADGTSLALLSSAADPAHVRGVVLLVHGFTGSKEDFVILAPELAAAGYDACACDLRGVYESTSAGPFSLDHLAADVVALAASLGHDELPVHVVGHSFGGLVSARAIVAAPAAFTSLTLLCSGPAGFVHSADRIPVTMQRVTAFKEALEHSSLEEAWDAKVAFEGADLHPAIAAFLKQRFVSGSHEAVMAQVDGLLNAADVIDAVLATGVPGYVVYGAGDGTWAQSTQNETAARLGHPARVIADAVHSPALENVDATAQALTQIFAEAEQVAP